MPEFDRVYWRKWVLAFQLFKFGFGVWQCPAVCEWGWKAGGGNKRNDWLWLHKSSKGGTSPRSNLTGQNVDISGDVFHWKGAVKVNWGWNPTQSHQNLLGVSSGKQPHDHSHILTQTSPTWWHPGFLDYNSQPKHLEYMRLSKAVLTQPFILTQELAWWKGQKNYGILMNKLA